jgi:hypothetical protein
MSMANGCVGSLLRLSNRVIYLSWATCALALFTSYFSLMELSALRGLNPSDPYSWEVDYIDPTPTLIAAVGIVLYLIAFVAAGFLSLRWIYRANSNAHCLNANLGISPGWNVGWFFVPIATWWKPYEGVRDVWRISANPQDPASVERPSLLVKWWTFWLLTNIAGSASFRLQFRATEVSTAILADVCDIVSSIALIPATYFFLAVVRDITEKQQRFAATEDDASVLPDMGSA